MGAIRNAIDDVSNITIQFYFFKENQIVIVQLYSHSIVAGGLLDTS